MNEFGYQLLALNPTVAAAVVRDESAIEEAKQFDAQEFMNRYGFLFEKEVKKGKSFSSDNSMLSTIPFPTPYFKEVGNGGVMKMNFS